MTTGPNGHLVSVHERLTEALSRYRDDTPVSRFLHRAAPALIRATEATMSGLARSEASCNNSGGLK